MIEANAVLSELGCWISTWIVELRLCAWDSLFVQNCGGREVPIHVIGFPRIG